MQVLIFKKMNDLKPVGGPAGYVYNLKMGIDRVNNAGIMFSYLDAPSNNGRDKLKIINSMPGMIRNFVLETYQVNTYRSLMSSAVDFDFNKYDAVHFHSTLDLYKYRRPLENYRGIVLLNSHCPKAQHKEIIEDYISRKTYHKYQKMFDSMEIVDDFSFNRADIIVFPCEEALEPYYTTWSKFSSIYAERISHFRYLPTGIKGVEAKESPESIRKKYNIPAKSKVICFIGRHNPTKGYDLLLELHKQLPDIYFLIAGSNEGIDYPKDDHWIEVGWTNDPYSIVNAADLFILPNRQTYFDLVLLEVLSLSKPVLISETGGNRYFSQYKSSGILMFKTVEEALTQIKTFFSMDDKDKIIAGENNGTIFQDNFTCEKFAQNYISLLSALRE